MAHVRQQWSTFLQKPQGKIPSTRTKNLEAPANSTYKVIIQKQKPRPEDRPYVIRRMENDLPEDLLAISIRQYQELLEEDGVAAVEASNATNQLPVYSEESVKSANHSNEQDGITTTTSPSTLFQLGDDDDDDASFLRDEEDAKRIALDTDDDEEDLKRSSSSCNPNDTTTEGVAERNHKDQLLKYVQEIAHNLQAINGEIPLHIHEGIKRLHGDLIDLLASSELRHDDDNINIDEHEDLDLEDEEEEHKSQNGLVEDHHHQIRDVPEEEPDNAPSERIVASLEVEKNHNGDDIEDTTKDHEQQQQQSISPNNRDEDELSTISSHGGSSIRLAQHQDRPIVLPGGRKWYQPDDVNSGQQSGRHWRLSETRISEAIETNSEVLNGRLKGINFLKFKRPPPNLQHLEHSEVYKMLHEQDVLPRIGISTRPVKALAAEDYYRNV